MNNRHLRSPALRAPVAPLFRGPQAASHDKNPHAPNAALLIDFDNVTMGIRSDLQTELRNLLSSDIISGKVAVQRAYADWRRYPQYIVPLSESSIDLIFAPAYGSSKKNATDIRLAVDAMELVFTRPEIGTYILLSGDSDFSSLVLKLKEYGKYVIGVGIRESSSDLLVQNCDEYYSYNALAGLVKSGDETTQQKWDPWELVTESISRMKTNGDVMRSDRLKQVMQEIDPTFDEKNLGMSKFSRFCQEASHKGLLHLTKLENGQLEVAPPGATQPGAAPAPVAPAAPVAAAPREDDEGGRSRRGRRGGRGRGRDRDRSEPRAELRAEAPAASVVAPESTPAPAHDGRGHGAHKSHEPKAHEHKGHDHKAHEQKAHEQKAHEHKPHERRPHHAPKIDPTVGVSGMRLTRDEAFGLVVRAVESLVVGDAPAMAEAVRVKARELLGRDSESLSDRNFTRILRDTHDAGRVDVRRRGDSFEVAKVEGAVSVADQLTAAEAQAKAEAPAAPAPAAAPRGVGAGRGLPAKGRAGKLPPSLLLLGVVEDTPAAPAAEAVAAEAPAPKKGRGRKPKSEAKLSAKADVKVEPKHDAKAEAKSAPKAKRGGAKQAGTKRGGKKAPTA